MKAIALAVGLLTVGSITLDYAPGSSATDTFEAEVRLGALATGSSGGMNGTEGSASVVGSLVSVTTDVLYLNNTNSTGAWTVRLASVSTSGLGSVLALEIGIDNGTRTPQVTGSLGALTQTTGSHVRLEPGSANRIYVTHTVSTLVGSSAVAMRLYAADDASESAYVVTTMNLTLT